MPKDDDRLDRTFQIRATAELLDLMRKAAKLDGRSVSNWARDRLEKAARREVGKAEKG